MIDVTVRVQIHEGGDRTDFAQSLSSPSSGPYAARETEKLIANAAQKVLHKVIATKGDIRAENDGVDRTGRQYYLVCDDGSVTEEDMVAAAGLDGPRQLAKAVDKENEVSALTGCGDEHVLAVIGLVQQWRRDALRVKGRTRR